MEDLEFDANKVWCKLFHPLKIGTIVKVKDWKFKHGYYIGKIMKIYKHYYRPKNWCYEVEPMDWSEEELKYKCAFHVKKESIEQVIEKESI